MKMDITEKSRKTLVMTATYNEIENLPFDPNDEDDDEEVDDQDER